jgi:hypothetical protein
MNRLTVRKIRTTNSDREAYIAAMWLMFLRAPGRDTAPGEPVDLGEIGLDAPKNWEPLTPYSPAVKISGVKFQNERPLIAFVNDLDEPECQPKFWLE